MSLGKSQLLGLRDYIRGYKVYTVLLSQTGVNVPSIDILENTLGQVPTFTYGGPGNYLLNVTGNIFVTGKTWFIINNDNQSAALSSCAWVNSNQLSIITIVPSTEVKTNNLLNKTSFEIRVYP